MLPEKPSAFLRHAVSDLKKCEDDPNYRVTMYNFHSPNMDGRVFVCLAGAVMAKSLNANPYRWMTPGDFEYTAQLEGLSYLVFEDWEDFFNCFGIEDYDGPRTMRHGEHLAEDVLAVADYLERKENAV